MTAARSLSKNFSKKFSKQDWATICLGIYAASTLVAMAVMSMGLVFLVAAFFLLFRSPREAFAGLVGNARIPSVVSAYRRAALLFLGALLISLMAAWIAPAHIGAVTVEITPFKDLLKAWYLFLPLLLWRVGADLSESGFSRLLRIWLLTCAALSAIGIVQHFTGWPKPQFIPRTMPLRFHATMFLGHHLSVASIWIFPAFTALSLLIHRRGPEISGIPRRVLCGITVLAFVTLFLGYSRMLWIALGAGFILMPFLVLRGRKIGVVAVLLVIACAGIYQVPAVHSRLQSAFGIEERYDLWEANWEFFKLRPLTGVGWRKSGDLSGPYLMQKYPLRKSVFAGHAHNNFLEVMAGTGLVGMAAWIFWCFTVFQIIWKGRKNPIFAAFFPGLFTAWVVFQLNGLTQVNFWEGKVLHQMMWAVGLSLIILGRRDPKASRA